jgi:phthiodiolone/phenolphthiodiolone dimycocerosates ketoreductase
MREIRFGFAELSVDPRLAIECGILAEKSGFDFLWVPDHLADVNGDKIDPWTVLSAVAVQTKKIMLASAVTDTQRIHPAKTAHIVACLDGISNGRAVLGIGAGEAMNITPVGLPWGAPDERVARLREAIEVIKLMWASSRNNPANYLGHSFVLKNAFLGQSPTARPHPPIYIGAFSSRKALELVGAYAQGWYGWINTAETFKKRWDTIRNAAKLNGRPSEEIDLSTHILVGFPSNSEELRKAMLSAKLILLLEKKTLATLGYADFSNAIHYQDLVLSSEEMKKIFSRAEEVPDEAVYKTMAIGGIDKALSLIETLRSAGVNHFAVGDLLAPQGSKKTIAIFENIIKRCR